VIVKYLLKVAMLGSAWVMYLLLLLSVASIAAMVERALYFRKYGKGGEDLGDALLELLEQGDRAAAEGLLSRHAAVEAAVLRASLRWSDGGPEALASGIDGEMTKRRKELERGMTLLGTLGNNAPFVGLLGTVIGVIVAFADLAGGSSKVNMDKVMSGIAEALVATGVGLFVAIPAVVAYNVFQKKIADVEDNVASISKRLCALLATVGSFDDLAPARGDDAVMRAAESARELPGSVEDGRPAVPLPPISPAPAVKVDDESGEPTAAAVAVPDHRLEADRPATGSSHASTGDAAHAGVEAAAGAED
jgi:biopolymer transport protein ExbB/biopolymer transport protein TolQ